MRGPTYLPTVLSKRSGIKIASMIIAENENQQQTSVRPKLDGGRLFTTTMDRLREVGRNATEMQYKFN